MTAQSFLIFEDELQSYPVGLIFLPIQQKLADRWFESSEFKDHSGWRHSVLTAMTNVFIRPDQNVNAKTRRLKEDLSWLSRRGASLPVCTEPALEGNTLNEDMLFLSQPRQTSHFWCQLSLRQLSTWPTNNTQFHTIQFVNHSDSPGCIKGPRWKQRASETLASTRLDLSRREQECWDDKGPSPLKMRKLRQGLWSNSACYSQGGYHTMNLRVARPGQALGNTACRNNDAKQTDKTNSTVRSKGQLVLCFC